MKMINFEHLKFFVNMETIRLQFQPNLKEKIMSFLAYLPKREVEIILENAKLEKKLNRSSLKSNVFRTGNESCRCDLIN